MTQRILPAIPRTALEKRLLPPVPHVVRSMLHSRSMQPADYETAGIQAWGRKAFDAVISSLAAEIENDQLRLEVLTWAEKFRPFVSVRPVNQEASNA